MTTTATYGNVEFSGVVTRGFRQEPVYTEDGMDLLYHKISVAFSGYVHGITDSTTVTVSPQGIDAADTYAKIRGTLGRKRQKFTYNISGFEILSVSPQSGQKLDFGNGKFDVTGGPTPKVFSISHVAGSQTFRVDVEIECNVVYAANTNTNTKGVLSNRWSCTDEYDQNFFCTRTFDGTVRLANPNVNPHEYRDYILPRLIPGVRMERMSISSSTDNLTLKYTVTHREIARAAPAPASSWKFSHALNVGDGVISTSDIAIYMAGRRTVNKKRMIQVATALFESRAGYNSGVKPADFRPTVIVESLTMTDIYSDSENAIEVRGRVKHIGGAVDQMKEARNKLGGRIDIPGYDSRISRDPNLEVTITQTSTLAAALQEPYDAGLRNIADGITARPTAP